MIEYKSYPVTSTRALSIFRMRPDPSLGTENPQYITCFLDSTLSILGRDDGGVMVLYQPGTPILRKEILNIVRIELLIEFLQ
jgi:hypothetical protein